MKCIDMEELISLYIDNMLDEHMKILVENHLAECKDCKSLYEALKLNMDLCSSLPSLQLPEDYEKTLHDKLVAIEVKPDLKSMDGSRVISNKRKKKYSWKVISSIAAVLLISIISIGMLNGLRMDKSAPQMEMAQDRSYPLETKEMEYDIADGGSMGASEAPAEMSNLPAQDQVLIEEEQSLAMRSQSVEQNTNQNLTSRKVINNAFVNLDIEGYDEKFDQIVNMITSKGGYVEHSDTQYKHYIPEKPEDSLKRGNINARIPQDIFLDTVNEIKTLGTVTNYGMGGQDITMQYRDTASEIENLKVQEERLREIMTKAENVKDILEVERELTRVRGSINNLSGNIERWDDLVQLSTINITLNEISPKDKRIESVSENIWDKASRGFVRTVNSLLEFTEQLFIKFISILPVILVLGILIIPVIIIIKRMKRRD